MSDTNGKSLTLGHSYGPSPTSNEMGLSKPQEQQPKLERLFGDITSILDEVGEYEIDSKLGFSTIHQPKSDGAKLWAILTALRGPDTGSCELKAATTAIIRAKLGIPEDNAGGAIVNNDSITHLKRRTSAKMEDDSHFIGHAKAAFYALGLKWDEVNQF